MSDSDEAKRAIKAAMKTGPSGPDGPDGPGWTPMPASEFATELARSHPHYAVEKCIGHGGMGAVYLANDSRVSRRVAIKILRPDALHDEAYLRRFDREIESLRRLEHPNTVRVLDAGDTLDGYRFFVMELLEGQTLAAELEDHRLLFERSVQIMTDICAGAQHVHERGIVHRDLKAANVFVVKPGGRAVILDFGVARDFTLAPSTLSKDGVPGTQGHIAPELREEKPATPASDVFSLGVIFLHMLAGKIPDGAYVMPSKYGYDSRLDAVVTKALSLNPEDRYAGAEDFADAIKAATEPAAQFAKQIDPVPPPTPRRESESPSTTLMSTKGKPNDASTSTSTAPTPKDIVFPSETRLQLHRDYLANWTPPKPTKTWTSVPVSENERWEVIDQWNAFPDLPSFEDVKSKLKLRRKVKRAGGVLGFGLALVLAVTSAVNGHSDLGQAFGIVLLGGLVLALVGYFGAAWLFDQLAKQTIKGWNWHDSFLINEYLRKHLTPLEFDPHQLFWREPHLYASRDHCHFTGWHWREEKSTNEKPRYANVRVSDEQTLFSVGAIDNVFFSDSYNSHFLAKAESFWWWRIGLATDHWTIYDREGNIRKSIHAHSWNFGLFGNMRSKYEHCLRS